MSSRSSSRTSGRSGRSTEAIVVGRIGTAHGLRGEVTVEVFSDNPGRFAKGSVVLADGGELRVRISRRHGQKMVVGFEDVLDRDAALALRGKTLTVDRPENPNPPEGEYYHYQLLGCRCNDLRVGLLGTVEDVLEDGGGVLLKVVGADGGSEVLVPFVDAFLRHVDIETKVIEVEVPPGLIEVCGSK